MPNNIEKLYQNLKSDGYQLGSREDFFGKLRESRGPLAPADVVAIPSQQTEQTGETAAPAATESGPAGEAAGTVTGGMTGVPRTWQEKQAAINALGGVPSSEGFKVRAAKMGEYREQYHKPGEAAKRQRLNTETGKLEEIA